MKGRTIPQASTLDPQPSGRQTNPLLYGISLAALTGLLFALSSEDGPVLCPFRRCTGGYCPGCGLTRSGGRLLRGDLSGSYQQHPYLVLGLTQAVLFLTIYSVGSAAMKKRLQRWYRPLLFANLGLLLAIWVVRLINSSIPIPFVG